MTACLQRRAVLPLLAVSYLLVGCRSARHELVLTHVGNIDNRAVASYRHVWSDFVFQTPPADATVAVMQPLPADRAADYAGAMMPRTDKGSQSDDQAASGIGSKADTAGLAVAANSGGLASGAGTADLTAGDNAADLASGAKAGGQTAASDAGGLAAGAKAGDLTSAANTGGLAAGAKAGDLTSAANTGDLAAGAKAGDLTLAASTGDSATGSKAGAQAETAIAGDLNTDAQAGGSRLTDQSGRASSATASGDQEAVALSTRQHQQTQSSGLDIDDLASSSRAETDAASILDRALAHHDATDDHASRLCALAIAPVLTLTKTALDEQVLAGKTASFVLSLRNEGELELESISIHEYLPDNCVFIRAKAIGRRLKVSGGGRSLLLGGTLAPGESCELRVTVRALAPDSQPTASGGKPRISRW